MPVEPTTDKRLPEPSSHLSKSVPTKLMLYGELANAEVVKLDTARGSRTGPYLMLTPAQRYEVGKLICKEALVHPVASQTNIDNSQLLYM